jgi:hypothetical protein
MGAAIVAGIAGVALAYQFGLAAGGSIVLAAIGLYGLVLAGKYAVDALARSDPENIRAATGAVDVDAGDSVGIDDETEMAVDGGDSAADGGETRQRKD